MSAHPAAVHGARAERDNRLRVLGSLNQMLGAGLVGDAKRLAAPALEHSALVHENVVAGFDRLLLGFLHRPTGRRGKRLGVVERQKLEHNLCRIGSLNLSEGLRAACARRALDPDDRIQVSLSCTDNGVFQCRSNARSRELGKSCCDRDRTAKLHKAASRDPPRFKHAGELGSSSFVYHVHTSSFFSLKNRLRSARAYRSVHARTFLV